MEQSGPVIKPQEVASHDHVLGKAAFQAYKAGAVSLQDFVGRKRSQQWGTMRYTRSLRDILGPEEARRWMEKVIDKQAMSQRMKDQWTDQIWRRNKMESRVSAMSDRALRAEVERQSQATWNRSRLLEHVKKHQRDYERLFGHPVGAAEIEELSYLVIRSWDRAFIGYEADGRISYTFAAKWEAGKSTVLLTVTRTGTIRTLMPTDFLSRFLGRHPELVEVTQRVRRT